MANKVTIRKVGKRWVVDRREGGKRRRTFFPSKTAAEAEASQVRSQVRDSGQAWLSLSAKDRNRLLAVWTKAQERGLDLEALVENAANATPPVQITIEKAIEALVQHSAEEGCSERYRYQMKGALDRFAVGRESMQLALITSAEIASWLSGRTQWTRSTYRQRLSTLFRFGLQQGWLTSNPMDRVPGVRITAKAPCILSLAQHEAALRSLLNRPRGLAWYILTTLAGLRPEEAANTTWDNILLDGDAPLVRVEAQTSKIRQRRIVYLHPTATAWLRHAKKKRAELPLVYQPRRRAQMAIRKVLGFEKWPQDITRHTAASYWLANTQDAASLAESLGHSVDVLKRHYRAIVTKEEAQRFWSITPETLSASATVHVDFVAAAIAGAGVG